MPSYVWMKQAKVDFTRTGRKLRVLRSLGVPYSDGEISGAAGLARMQATAIQTDLEGQGIRIDPQSKMVALIAYLQRLGRGPQWKPPASGTESIGARQ
jgi:cytochrome c oxidase cbb3-type subunit I/II